MIVLSRMKNESVTIGGNIHIKILEIRGDRVRIEVNGSPTTSVHRAEAYNKTTRASKSPLESTPPSADLPSQTEVDSNSSRRASEEKILARVASAAVDLAELQLGPQATEQQIKERAAKFVRAVLVAMQDVPNAAEKTDAHPTVAPAAPS